MVYLRDMLMHATTERMVRRLHEMPCHATPPHAMWEDPTQACHRFRDVRY